VNCGWWRIERQWDRRGKIIGLEKLKINTISFGCLKERGSLVDLDLDEMLNTM
jgi:hypothetical protein